MVNALLIICNNMWRTGKWPTLWTQSLVVALPGSGGLRLCQSCQAVGLVGHPGRVLLEIILNRLKPEAEKIIGEEQAGFRPGRSTTEQIFNLGILCERHIQHQQDLYHVFIDFKKAFDRVWQVALWATVRLYNINTNLINAIRGLCDGPTGAVCFGRGAGDWFGAAVGVGQSCLLLPTLFGAFLERIMADALEDHKSTVSIGGRTVSNFRFADDIDGLTKSELELANLVERLHKTSTAYGIQISAEKTKLMTNNTNGISSNIRVNGEKLETVCNVLK